MTNRDYCKKMARNAKRAGFALNKVIPTKEPYRSIFEAEYNRFQPRTK